MQALNEVLKIAPKGSAERGLARYDFALASYYAGRYEDSRVTFESLLRSRERGYDRRNAAMMLRHASACAGYHQYRSAAGITEPQQIDPLCGAEGIAVALRRLGLPYSRAHVLPLVSRTGEGSSLQDLIDACPKLGVKGYPVSVQGKGLMALFRSNGGVPVIAHVEHDHFITVTGADSAGVYYLCADCGGWPGGRRFLDWKRWFLMEADAYLAISKPGTNYDRALSMLPAPRGHALPSLLVQTQALPNATLSAARQIVASLGGAVVSLIGYPSGAVVCGQKPEATHCPPSGQGPSCPCESSPGSSGPSGGGGGNGSKPPAPVAAFSAGSTAGDPVNLATGEEEYAPPADLQVYNPTGPSVTWRREYYSLSNSHSCFGQSWTHPFNISIQVVGPTATTSPKTQATTNATMPVQSSGFGYVVYSNGAKAKFTPATTTPPTASSPHVACTVAPGTPLQVSWDYDPSVGKDRYTVTFTDRTKWVSDVPNSSGYNRPITRVADRNGNSILLTYGVYQNFFGPEAMLQKISDSAGVALLTLTLDPNGLVSAASDRYGRTVYYHVGSYSTTNTPSGWQQYYPEVDQVSQIVASGTTSPPVRYAYGYQNSSNLEGSETVPFLHTIGVPSPTGSGTATTTINYSPSNAMVTSIVDANGNARTFSVVDQLHTKVTYTNPQGTVDYSYTSGFTSNMGASSATDGNGAQTHSWSYSDPNDPNRPSSDTDGNNRMVSCTYDVYGHVLTTKNPAGVVTTNTFDYSVFPLGEVVSTSRSGHTGMSFAYAEPSGLVTSVSTPKPGTVNTGEQTTDTVAFDALGNETSTTRPGNNASPSLTATKSYTADGSYTQAAAVGQPILITTAAGRVTHLRYDSRGNLISKTDGLGNEVDYTYNLANQRTSIVYPATGQSGSGRSHFDTAYLYVGGPPTATTVYDESGTAIRQATMTYGPEGEAKGVSGEGEPTAYAYDSAYRVTMLTDGNGHATSYAYNAKGYLSQATNADGTARSYTSYDGIGNLLSRTDERGVVVNYAYNDINGHLTDVSYPGTPSMNVHYAFDTLGRATGWTDGTGSFSSVLDDNGLPTSTTQAYANGPSRTFTTSYYPSGDPSAITIASGQSYSLSYNADGQIVGETNPLSQSWAWDYLSNGWIWRETQAQTAFRTEYTYNARGLATDIDHYTVGSPNVVLSDFSNLTYDGEGNLLSETASFPGTPSLSGTTTFVRNARNQVTQEQFGSASANYAYDPAGNATTFKGSARTYNAVNGVVGPSYDPSGNPAAAGGLAIAYDAEGRPTSFGGALGADYRADGQRAWKLVGGVKTFYFYRGTSLLLETDASGNQTALNTWGARGIVARQTTSANLLYAFDPQGNAAQQVSGSTGAVLAGIRSDAYGTTTKAGAAVADPYSGIGGQVGYYLDVETGLCRLGARYYDPSAGRFLTKDPIGVLGGVNLYAFCGGDPVGRVDPEGTSWFGLVGDAAKLEAACGSSALGAIGNIVAGFFDSGGQSVTGDMCTAAGYCLGAMMTFVEDAASTGFTPLVGCIMGAMGTLIGDAVAFACQQLATKCPPPMSNCLLGSTLLNAGLGCATGALGGIPYLGSVLLGCLNNMLSSAAQSQCGDTIQPGPGGGSVSLY